MIFKIFNSIKLSDFRKILSFAKNVVKLFLGESIMVHQTSSGTLDIDDVTIAKSLLKHDLDILSDNVVLEYQNKFKELNQSQHAYAFMAGRHALSACIYALGLKKGDKVLVPGFTCIVVPNAFWYEGIEIIFYDIELETFGPNINDLRLKYYSHPDIKCVLLHHLFGIVARDYKACLAFAKEKNIFVIEDCAHSFGAKLDGLPVGNLGDIAFYSSEQSKALNTSQGGVAITNNLDLAKRLSKYQRNAPAPNNERVYNLLKTLIYNYYKFKYPWRKLIGYWKVLPYRKYRLVSTTKQEEQSNKPEHYGQKIHPALAQIGINQLKKSEKYNNLRRETAKKWNKWCRENNFAAPTIIENSTPIYLRYPVIVSEEMKKDRTWALEEFSINLGVWFVSHLHPIQYEVEDCPNADIAVKSLINFPTILK